jgi:hypothetical protein
MRLFINGVEIENASMVRIDYSVEGVVTPPPPDPLPEPEPEPTPPPAPDQPCGQVPNRVTLTGSVDLANPGSQRSYDLGAETKAIRFVMTATPAFAQFAIANKTGSMGVQRTAWISRCPGGEPVTGSVATGTENTSVRISNSPRRGYATLAAGVEYYLNIRNGASAVPGDPTTCATGNCGVYLIVYSG